MYSVNHSFHLGSLLLYILMSFCIWIRWSPGAPLPTKSAPSSRIMTRRRVSARSASSSVRSSFRSHSPWRSPSRSANACYVESPPAPRIWKAGIACNDSSNNRKSRSRTSNINPASANGGGCAESNASTSRRFAYRAFLACRAGSHGSGLFSINEYEHVELVVSSSKTSAAA